MPCEPYMPDNQFHILQNANLRGFTVGATSLPHLHQHHGNHHGNQTVHQITPKTDLPDYHGNMKQGDSTMPSNTDPSNVSAGGGGLSLQGMLCHPYLSLQYYDILQDVNARGFAVGATNILFKQKRHLLDAIIEVNTGRELDTFRHSYLA